MSSALGASNRSFTCVKMPLNRKITCTDTLMTPEFSGPVGTIYQVGCPEKCADELLNLFGDELYSGDSSIC